jgi:hypothetical protein
MGAHASGVLCSRTSQARWKRALPGRTALSGPTFNYTRFRATPCIGEVSPTAEGARIVEDSPQATIFQIVVADFPSTTAPATLCQGTIFQIVVVGF